MDSTNLPMQIEIARLRKLRRYLQNLDFPDFRMCYGTLPDFFYSQSQEGRGKSLCASEISGLLSLSQYLHDEVALANGMIKGAPSKDIKAAKMAIPMNLKGALKFSKIFA